MPDNNFDFTSRDFTSVRSDMLARASVTIPEWTTRDPSDFGVLLVELWAYAADMMSYYIDRAAYEAFLSTAVRRESVLNIADMLDYRPVARTPSVVTLTFTRAAGYVGAITVPAGTVVSTGTSGNDQPVKFQTDTLLSIAGINNSGTVTATEGLSKEDELLGSSIGLPNQQFLLQYVGIYENTVQLFVAEGALDVNNEPALVEWNQVDRLITEDSTSASFSMRTAADGSSYIVLGDGVHGRIPSTNTRLFATYRYGMGNSGNVGAGAVIILESAVTGVGAVSNAAPSSSGTDAESIESMRVSIPNSLGAVDRAVTVADHKALALKVAGVTKANSKWTSGTVMNVVVAWSTPLIIPNAALRNAVEAYIEARQLASWSVSVGSPQFVAIQVTMDLHVLPQYVRSWVVADAIAAVAAMLDYDKQDFAQRFRLGDVYRTVLAVEGVDWVNITKLDTGIGLNAEDQIAGWDEIFYAGSILTGTVTGGITG